MENIIVENLTFEHLNKLYSINFLKIKSNGIKVT